MGWQDFVLTKCLIDGEWVEADSGETFSVTNPATGEEICTVPKMGEAETRRAIDAAHRAMPAWAALTAGQRADYLRKLYDLMMQHQAQLGELLTREQGKPLSEGCGEVAYSASFIQWFAEEGRRAYGEVIPRHEDGKRIVTLRQPVGVVGAITPWNFPSAMIGRKLGPALAAGCTFVLKPASITPLSALVLGKLAQEAGIPNGVFNIVTGSSSEIGKELTTNNIVRKISFTGSTEVGRTLMKQSSETIKKMSLELGGNAPFIVFDDADIDAAVDGAMSAKFRNGGQTCVCTNRFYVQDSVHDEFVEKFRAKVDALKLGNGVDDGVDIGPLIEADAVTKVEEHLFDATDGGAKIISGGKRSDEGDLYFQPTVLTGVKHDMLVAREETFGPLAAIIKFSSEEEVIEMANDTEFGLASYFYSESLRRVWRVAEAIESGIVGVNTGLISTEVAPFGGVKQSGLGREGSRHGLDDYMEIKYVCMGV